MSAEMLGWLGIALTVIFGVAAFFFARNVRRKTQNQKIDRGGIGYQAGGDIKLDDKN